MTSLLDDVDPVSTTTLDMRRLQRQARRVKRRRNTAIAVAVGLMVFAVGGSVAWSFAQGFRSDPNVIADYEGPGSGTIVVVIEPGDSGSTIADTLLESGVIASKEAFLLAWNDNPEASRVTPGHYFVQREMRAEFALAALLDPNNRDELRITIPEGRGLNYYFQRIADLTDYSVEEVRAAAEDTAALGLPPEADGNLEGWLFPSTYTFNPGTHPVDIMAEMVALTVRVLDERGVDPDDRVRILTIASLVEKEAKLDEDRPMIAGVIQNRLDDNTPLEFDSTVKYISPSPGVFTTSEERAIDSPYNTYRYAGLPPGPIAAPGAKSIDAAIDPANHDYKFFVTVNLSTGETMYAERYDDHLKNVAIMQEWVRENGQPNT